MDLAESTACREAALAGRLAYLDSGTGSARVRLYGSTRAATVDDAPGTALLAEITLQKPAGTVTAGALTLLQVAAGSIAITGDATWARVVSGDDAAAFDMDAGVTGSGAQCILTTATLYAGGLVSLVSAALI